MNAFDIGAVDGMTKVAGRPREYARAATETAREIGRVLSDQPTKYLRRQPYTTRGVATGNPLAHVWRQALKDARNVQGAMK